ncbi:MAG: hypothetical protein GY717_16940 [Rhodobacteraceae bacterium]|nr:hypothetical protein [Paracoccaceae bacterium]
MTQNSQTPDLTITPQWARKSSGQFRRRSIYYFFLKRVAKFDNSTAVVVTLLPLAIIVTALVMLNLEQAIFDLMGGIRDETSTDHAYGLLFFISVLSTFSAPILLIMYALLVYKAHRATDD